MRIIIKLFVVVFVAVGLSGYAAYLRTGQLPWHFLKAPELPQVSLPDSVKPSTKSDTVYKWRDENGVWQYTSTPPAGGEAEKMVINRDQNIIAAVKSPQAEPETTLKSGEEPSGVGNEDTPALYSPEGIKSVMDQAKQVQQQMNERASQEKKILDSL